MEFSPSISSTVRKTRADLEKSARLLDDAMSSTGKSLLRVSRNTPQRRGQGSLRRGWYIFKGKSKIINGLNDRTVKPPGGGSSTILELGIRW
jgi:hypothetical protein